MTSFHLLMEILLGECLITDENIYHLNQKVPQNILEQIQQYEDKDNNPKFKGFLKKTLSL